MCKIITTLNSRQGRFFIVHYQIENHTVDVNKTAKNSSQQQHASIALNL